VTEDVEYEEPEEEKCRFWPDCKNGDECEYYHPDIACKYVFIEDVHLQPNGLK
jgi:hypothetical protein